MLPWFALPVGCMRGPEQKGKPDHIPEVEVSVPLQDLVTDSEEFTGRIVAVDTITVRARATGYLDRVNFREGVEVNKGDVLFEIDPRTYKADYERAMANLVQAEARLKRVEADYHRARTSFSRGAVSSEDLDHALYDRNEADAAVGVARASRDSAQLNLDFTKVIAPVSGRISRRLVDPGNLIKADDTPLTTIVSQDPIYVYFHVDERTTLRIRRLILEGKVKSARVAAMPVNVGLSDEVGFPHHGVIDFVDNQLDAGTGTLQLRGRLPNPPNSWSGVVASAVIGLVQLSGQPWTVLGSTAAGETVMARAIPANRNRLLSPNLFVRVQIPFGEPHKTLMVAESALGTDQGQKYAYVVEEEIDKNGVKTDVARYRKVDVGPLVNGLRVIDQGLALRDSIVVRGLQRVRPNAPIQARLVPMPRGPARDVAPLAKKSAPPEGPEKERSGPAPQPFRK
jgi:RND family efflux transporter MFP subunit